jgi:hypothetical protein
MQVVRKASVVVALAAITLCSGNAFAGEELLGVDAKFRAKIAREKIRAAAQERKFKDQEKNSLNQSGCGSQSIGNVDTGVGPAPREVFVFAPNAINIVGRGGCR